MTETIAIERVDHIGIRVRNLDRALGFYRVLGFTLAHRATGTTSRSSATSTASSLILFSTPMPAIRTVTS
jgi:catechol 2,3-dioxygenase-like lactoylglutathione lyase family enzyme